MGNCTAKQSKGKKGKFVMSRANVKDLRSVYDIDQTCLGAGSFGKVFKATNLQDKSMKVAIKVINKKGMSDEDIEMLKNEVQLMQQVDHPNIVKYYETFNDKKYIYLVMELCTGGDLFKFIDEGRVLSENEASMQLDKCFKALQHCHAQNIIHRDLKPENIMYATDGEIKLIDFGFALIQRKQKAEMDIAGTPYYIAPEVLTGVYGNQCDIWSMGVCLYQILTGQLPFQGTSQKEVFGKIQSGEFNMPERLSDQCKDLLRKMIEVDPKSRYTCQQCIEHPFIKQGDKLSKSMSTVAGMTYDQVSALNQEVIENLRRYKGKSMLRKAAMNVLVKHLQPASIQKLKSEFEKLDTDNSGFLEVQELKQAIYYADHQMTSEEINEIINNLDYAQNQKINYSEFIAATINVSEFLTDEKLEAIFKTFDIDHTGKITADNLKLAFSKFGREISDNDIAVIMKEHDIDGEGTVDFEEFKQMMNGI